MTPPEPSVDGPRPADRLAGEPTHVRAWWIALAALVAVAALAVIVYWVTFRPTPIGSIVKDPRGFDERVVLVKGTVKRSAGLLGYGAFEVEDSTGRITVVTDSGLPPSGARVTVRGVAKNAYTLGDHSLTVIVAKKHAGRWLFRGRRSGRSD